MKAHNLKLDDLFFDDVKSGEKTFEIRNNDRDFRVGDFLVLHRSDEGVFAERKLIKDHPSSVWSLHSEKLIESDEWNSDFITAEVTYITDYKQQEGYVALGIKLVDIVDKAEQDDD